MNIKAKKAKVQPLSKKSVINVLSQDEIKKKVQVIYAATAIRCVGTVQ